MIPSSNIENITPSDDTHQLHIVELYMRVILPGDELLMIDISILTLSTWQYLHRSSHLIHPSLAICGV
jgi:hypothetical protein